MEIEWLGESQSRSRDSRLEKAAAPLSRQPPARRTESSPGCLRALAAARTRRETRFGKAKRRNLYLRFKYFLANAFFRHFSVLKINTSIGRVALTSPGLWPRRGRFRAGFPDFPLANHSAYISVRAKSLAWPPLVQAWGLFVFAESSRRVSRAQGPACGDSPRPAARSG